MGLASPIAPVVAQLRSTMVSVPGDGTLVIPARLPSAVARTTSAKTVPTRAMRALEERDAREPLSQSAHHKTTLTSVAMMDSVAKVPAAVLVAVVLVAVVLVAAAIDGADVPMVPPPQLNGGHRVAQAELVRAARELVRAA